MRVGSQRHSPAALPLGKDRVPIVREASWTSVSVCTGAENLAPTVIRSPDSPACSESLYRLSHPGPTGTGRLKNIDSNNIRVVDSTAYIHVL